MWRLWCSRSRSPPSENAESFGVASFPGNATLSDGAIYAGDMAAGDMALSGVAIPSGAAALSGGETSREGLGWSDQGAVLTSGIMISEVGPLTVTIAIENLMALLASAMRISKRLWQQHVSTPFTLGICLRCHGK